MPKTTKKKSSNSNAARWLFFVILLLLCCYGFSMLFTPSETITEVPLSDIISKANTPNSEIEKITVEGNRLRITYKGQKHPTETSYKDASGTLYDQGLIDHCSELSGAEAEACHEKYPAIEYVEPSNFWD